MNKKVKLLIITQKVDRNDDILGFFHRWILEFAKHYEFVTVIALQVGEYDLPKNVKVLSLGKKDFRKEVRPRGGALRWKRSFLEEKIFSKIKYTFNFYKYIWRERKNYDTVFVHMNPIYVVLGGLLWKLWNKKIGLWYTHKSVDVKLRIAEMLADSIFTASIFSFQLKSKKLNILGHGIDVDLFKCPSRMENNKIEIVSIGRITKIKGCDILIKAGKILSEKWNKDFKITFVGSPITNEDHKYLFSVKKLLHDYRLEDNVRFVESVSNDKVKEFYCNADIATNSTPTGGIDKVVIESMAAETLVLTSNKAFREYFGKYADNLIFEYDNANDLAEKIMDIYKYPDRDDIIQFLYKQAQEKFGIEKLISRIHHLL